MVAEVPASPVEEVPACPVVEVPALAGCGRGKVVRPRSRAKRAEKIKKTHCEYAPAAFEDAPYGSHRCGSKLGPVVPGGSNTEKSDNAPTARVDAILGGWFQWFQLFIEKEKKFSFSRRPVGPT